RRDLHELARVGHRRRPGLLVLETSRGVDGRRAAAPGLERDLALAALEAAAGRARGLEDVVTAALRARRDALARAPARLDADRALGPPPLDEDLGEGRELARAREALHLAARAVDLLLRQHLRGLEGPCRDLVLEVAAREDRAVLVVRLGELGEVT